MRTSKIAGCAVVGSLGLSSLVMTSFALLPSVSAAAAPRPAVTTKKATKPGRPSPKPTAAKSSPAPRVTVTRTAAPPEQCDVAYGQPAAEMTSAPWPQLTLNFTDAWPFTRGEGAKVAVVDSGVDTGHSQMPAVSTYDETGTSVRDCTGHGTMVAGIIAAQDHRDQHVPFLGVAPKAHLISVKVATREDDNSPQLVAKGIKRAADLGADIINVSIQVPNYPFLKSAVQYAQAKGALIVASAGNTASGKKDSEQPLYPASYDGVLSVGAAGRDGAVTDFTDTKSRVMILAPGKDIISTWPGNGYSKNDGTSFAAPYVSAVAALVKSYRPRLSAAQIVHRIEATADGRTSAASGYGMVNPLRAVTAVLPEEDGAARTVTVRPKPVAILTPDRKDSFSRNVALIFVGGALGIAAAVVAGGVIIPAGRSRGWRPGRRTMAQPESAESRRPEG